MDKGKGFRINTGYWASEADQLVYCLWLCNAAYATAVFDYITYQNEETRKSFVWAYIYNYNIIFIVIIKKNDNNNMTVYHGS